MSSIFIEQLNLFRISQELHDLMLSLSWCTAIWVHHINAFPFGIHHLHDLHSQLVAEVEQKLSSWRDGVGLEILRVLNSYFLDKVLEELNVFNAWSKSPVSWLIDLCSWSDSIESNVDKFLRINHSNQLQ